MWWDIGLACSALVGFGYWTVRRADASASTARRGDDVSEHVQLADAVLQGLVVAKLSIELDQRDRAMTALDSSIAAATNMISNLLGPQTTNDRSLLRAQPAVLEERA